MYHIFIDYTSLNHYFFLFINSFLTTPEKIVFICIKKKMEINTKSANSKNVKYDTIEI